MTARKKAVQVPKAKASKRVEQKPLESTPEAIETMERDARVLELRKTRMSFDEIARVVGYADKSGAYYSFQRAMQRTLQEPADELRRTELESLDRMENSLWTAALGGTEQRPVAVKDQLGASRQILRIKARRSALLGLDAPVQSRVEIVSEDEMMKLMRQLEKEVGELEGDGQVEGEPVDV